MSYNLGGSTGHFVPQLRGEENLEEWKRAVQGVLRVHDLTCYIDGSVTTPAPAYEQTSRFGEYCRREDGWRRGAVLYILASSVFPVMDRLLRAGCTQATLGDPLALWKLILQVIPDTQGKTVIRLCREFLDDLKPREGELIMDFDGRFHVVANRLEALGVEVSEVFRGVVFMRAVEEMHPVLHAVIEDSRREEGAEVYC